MRSFAPYSSNPPARQARQRLLADRPVDPVITAVTVGKFIAERARVPAVTRQGRPSTRRSRPLRSCGVAL
jgi:hypothetical protein